MAPTRLHASHDRSPTNDDLIFKSPLSVQLIFCFPLSFHVYICSSLYTMLEVNRSYFFPSCYKTHPSHTAVNDGGKATSCATKFTRCLRAPHRCALRGIDWFLRLDWTTSIHAPYSDPSPAGCISTNLAVCPSFTIPNLLPATFTVGPPLLPTFP
jgi:hypothetical protein